MRLSDLTSSGTIALLDAGVVRDIAASLTGVWVPEAEEHADRADELVAAARLRLYGDRERSGWLLVATRQAVSSALKRGDADWSVGMLPVVDDLDDAPATGDVDALTAEYRREQHLDAEAARTLATAVLFEPVGTVVSRVPGAMRHQRLGDLPSRLELIDPATAVERLGIAAGEQPAVSLPIGSTLEAGAHWWVP